MHLQYIKLVWADVVPKSRKGQVTNPNYQLGLLSLTVSEAVSGWVRWTWLYDGEVSSTYCRVVVTTCLVVAVGLKWKVNKTQSLHSNASFKLIMADLFYHE